MSGDRGQFGARLRAARHSAGLSQQDLAERSGLAVRSISNLERGRTSWPHPDSVYRLADALELREAARSEFVAAAARRLAGPAPAAAGAGPPPRRADRAQVVPRHLPATVPAFVGRQDQLAILSRVLHEPGGTAVITAIGGTAGVGKTTLAVRWAHQVAAEFPDGQLYADLRGFSPAGAPVTAAEAVRVFLDALHVPAEQIPEATEAQLGLYRSLLTGRRVLVLLDNARDEAQVRPLLPGSPTCRVIVTSRNQLAGLAVIEAARLLRLDVLSEAEAGLLLERRLGPGRVAAEPQAAARIIEACARLPLALSVIAAQAAMRPDLSLAELAEELAARGNLDAFAGEDPAADVRAAFSWSYRQLDAATAMAFRLASLHPGTALSHRAVAALAGLAPGRAREALDVLAHAHLIQSAGPDRYGLHDLLRSYARELADGPESQSALTRLLDYYLHAAATAMDAAFPGERHRRPAVPPSATPAPDFAGEAAALTWLRAEQASLVAVTAHAAEHGWPGHATRMSEILFRYLDTGAHYADAITIHGHARRAAAGSGDRQAEANALVSLGLVDGHQSRYQEATGHFERALTWYTQAGDRAGQAKSLNYLGLVALREGRYAEASGHLEQALAWYRDLDDQHGAAYALSNLARVDVRQGRYEEAARLQQEALALLRECGDRPGEVTVLSRLGDLYLRQGRYPQAIRHLREVLAHYQDQPDPQGEALALVSLGVIGLRQGRYAEAAGHLDQALAGYREMSDPAGQATTLNNLGEVLLATGQAADARRRYAAALDMAVQAGETYEQARARDGLGRACQAGGDPRRAHRHWQAALAIYSELAAPEADQVRARLAEAGPATMSDPATASG